MRILHFKYTQVLTSYYIKCKSKRITASVRLRNRCALSIYQTKKRKTRIPTHFFPHMDKKHKKCIVTQVYCFSASFLTVYFKRSVGRQQNASLQNNQFLGLICLQRRKILAFRHLILQQYMKQEPNMRRDAHTKQLQ